MTKTQKLKNYYSNGKLLLTGEYLVLDGAKSLAVPTKFGQDLIVDKIKELQLIWASFTNKGECWFESVFDLQKLRLVNCTFNSDKEGSAEFIAETLLEILAQDDIESKTLSAIVFLDLRYPLISHEKIEDAINTMVLFKADSLISVRADQSLFFKHDGSGMKVILNQDGKSKFERDVLYKHVGGITVTQLNSFLKNKKITHGKVGHIVLDKKSSYIIENKQDLEIVELINKKYNAL